MHGEEIQQTTNCASCGAALSGKFCSQCGEKVLRSKDKTLGHFFEEFFHILTHADSKFLKSLKYLVTKPGFLTTEYLSGRRKLYASPLSLFFIGNLLYLLLSTTDALNSSYDSQIHGQFYSETTAAQAEKKMQQRNWAPQQLEDSYDAKSEKISKLLLVLMIFLFSLPVAILFYYKSSYYYDHLVYATEFVNFIIYGLFIILYYTVVGIGLAINYVRHGEFSLHLDMWVATCILLTALFAQQFLSMRRVYKQGVFAAIIKTLLMLCSVIVISQVYRFILFQVTLMML